MRVFQKEFPKGTYPGQRNDGYPISNITLKNFEFVKLQVLKRNGDFCFCIDGRVGSGKTTLALQLAKVLDPTFNLSRVAFTPEQFLEILKTANKGEAVFFDEAYVISSRFAMSEFNKKVNSIMTQIRSKNLYIFFALPSIFDLDRTLALYRIDCLFHVYKHPSGSKGHYSVFFQDKVKDLYINGKKYYTYGRPKANYNSNFSNCFILDEKDYETKKQNAIVKISIGDKRTNKWKNQRDVLIKYLNQNFKLKYTEISQVIGDLTPDETRLIALGER